MPELFQQQRLFPYTGDLDSSKHPVLISPIDIVESENIIYTTYSTKRKRPGVQQAFTSKPRTARKIIAAHDFWRSGVQKIVYYDGSRIKAYDPQHQVEDDITGSTAIPVDESVCFIPFQGLLIITFGDGATPPQKWNGTGVLTNLGSTAPNARYGRVILNCLWLDDPSVPGRLSKSRTGDPTLFIGGDSTTLDLDVNDGDPDGVTAITPPLDGKFFVGKRLGLWRITPSLVSGSIVYSQEKVTDGLGITSHNAVKSVEYGLMFPSDRGVHFINSSANISGIETDFLTMKIQPDWVDDINFGRAKYMQAVYDTEFNCYFLLYPRVGQNFCSDLKGYSVVAKKWFDWPDYNHSSCFSYIDVLNKRKRTMFGSNSGNLGYLTHDKKTDYGVGYNVYFRSGIIIPETAPSSEFSLKALGVAYVPQLAGTFSMAYRVDGRLIDTFEYDMNQEFDVGDDLGEEFVVGISVLGNLPQLILDKRRARGTGNFYELSFSHTSTGSDDEDFEILGILTDINKTGDTYGRSAA